MLNTLALCNGGETMNAVLYMRYSSDNQTEQSIEGQRKDCERFAKLNKIDIIGEYIDRALTGTTDKRPEFQRMICDAMDHKFDAIIVWKLDRFSRNVGDSAVYSQKLKECGVKLISITENFDDTCEGEFLKNIMIAMNQYYVLELSRKIKRGMSVSAEKGHYCGAPLPSGLTYDKNTMEILIDEPKATIVKEVFRLFVNQGMSIAQIEEDLKKRGIKRDENTFFTGISIYRMLKNRKYIGEYKIGNTIGRIPRIIDGETFSKAQDRIKTKAKRPRIEVPDSDYMFTGKLFCSKCGGMMVADSAVKKNGKIYRYYKCTNAKKHKCDCRAIPKEIVEKTIENNCIEWLKSPQVIRDTAHAIYESQSKKTPLMESFEKRLEEINKSLRNLCKAIEMGIISETTKARLNELESEKKTIEESIGKEMINCRHADECSIWYALEGYRFSKGAPKNFMSFILHKFIDRIECTENGALSIIYKWKKQRVSVETALKNETLVRLGEQSLLH